MATTLTSRGQVTIPKAVRDMLGLLRGNQVEFILSDNGDVVVTSVSQAHPKSRFRALCGHAGDGLDTDAIMAMTRGEP